MSGSLAMWGPLRECIVTAKWLWVNLYTSSRRAMIGLWQGGTLTFADVAKMRMDETVIALDNLLENELVEFDAKHEVLRLTAFPDRSARPANGSILHSMWTQFKKVPACDVRNAHVRTLRDLLDDSRRPITSDHATAWEQTFGTVVLPAPRRRGVKKFTNDDTSTAVQPGLFATHQPKTESSTPHQTGHGVPHRLIIDHDPDRSSSLSEKIKSHADEPVDNLPLMVSVPSMDDLPFSVEVMLATVAAQSGGRFASAPFDGRLTAEMVATIRACERAGATVEDLSLVGTWLAKGGLDYRRDLGPAWVARPGNLLDAIANARAWAAQGKPDLVGTRARQPSRRIDPAPLGAHGNGKRVL